MGYTIAENSIFPSDMPQTPENIRMVLDFAGWTVREAAKALEVMQHGSTKPAISFKKFSELLSLPNHE